MDCNTTTWSFFQILQYLVAETIRAIISPLNVVSRLAQPWPFVDTSKHFWTLSTIFGGLILKSSALRDPKWSQRRCNANFQGKFWQGPSRLHAQWRATKHIRARFLPVSRNTLSSSLTNPISTAYEHNANTQDPVTMFDHINHPLYPLCLVSLATTRHPTLHRLLHPGEMNEHRRPMGTWGKNINDNTLRTPAANIVSGSTSTRLTNLSDRPLIYQINLSNLLPWAGSLWQTSESLYGSPNIFLLDPKANTSETETEETWRCVYHPGSPSRRGASVRRRRLSSRSRRRR